MDNRFIWSGSEDTNIRLWKANAAESLKMLLPREKEALAEAEKVKRKYQHNSEIRRIKKHKHLQAGVRNQLKKLHAKRVSRNKKDENMRLNNRPEDCPFIPNRTKDMDFKIE